MSRVDFIWIIHHQQQYNDEHLETESAEIILEDLFYTKYHSQNSIPILVFKGFWYISRQIYDAFSDYLGKT